MTRRVVTTELQADEATQMLDEFSDKLIKYIPADVVAFYIAVSGIIASQEDEIKPMLLWSAFWVGLIGTVLWTLRQTKMPNKPLAITQTAICTGAFVVWAIALGGPFALYEGYRPVFGSLLLAAYTFLVPLVNPPEG
jgi:hydrogenase/urease accessory protein HupE